MSNIGEPVRTHEIPDPIPVNNPGDPDHVPDYVPEEWPEPAKEPAENRADAMVRTYWERIIGGKIRNGYVTFR